MKIRSLAALTLIALGFALMGAEAAFAAEETKAADPNTAVETASPAVPEDLFSGIGAGLGAGLVVIGGGLGIGRIAGSAVESMARQPEMYDKINLAMLITAAMVEGATLFGIVVCFIAI